MVEESIKKLGYNAANIKIIINGHGYSDHAGGFAYLKKLSGAQVAIMEPDIAMLEDGGKSDFHYAGTCDQQFGRSRMQRQMSCWISDYPAPRRAIVVLYEVVELRLQGLKPLFDICDLPLHRVC